MFLKLILNVKNVASKGAGRVNTLPGLDLELSFLPIGDNFFLKGFLELELFIGGFSDLLDFFSELEEGALEQLLQGEDFTLVRNFFLNEFDNFLPMAVTDGWLRESGNERKDFSHVVNLLLKLLVGLPRLEGTGKFGAVTGELVDGLNHFVNFVDNLSPGDLAPFGNGILNLGVERVEFVEKLDLISSLC
jgi:hypothetical protein